jgi:hypothetical protein
LERNLRKSKFWQNMKKRFYKISEKYKIQLVSFWSKLKICSKIIFWRPKSCFKRLNPNQNIKKSAAKNSRPNFGSKNLNPDFDLTKFHSPNSPFDITIDRPRSQLFIAFFLARFRSLNCRKRPFLKISFCLIFKISFHFDWFVFQFYWNSFFSTDPKIQSQFCILILHWNK